MQRKAKTEEYRNKEKKKQKKKNERSESIRIEKKKQQQYRKELHGEIFEAILWARAMSL